MANSRTSLLPKSVEDYVNGIVGALPAGAVRERLKRLRLFKPADARPNNQESLSNWHHVDNGTAKEEFPFTVVVGETESRYRDRRPDVPSSGKMTMAKTCDGVFGARVAVAILQRRSMNLAGVDFDAVVDEWPELDKRLDCSHLIVIGSPEVNTCAAFLHGLVDDFYFGSNEWPPEVKWTGGMFCLEGKAYGRNPADGRQFHDGVVFLLKNPWNPDYRLLWIAGVSGRGTGFGCSLICNDWRGHEDESLESIGVVFRREMKDNVCVSEQFAWLCRQGNGLTWKNTLDEEPRLASPERIQVFLSHNSKDKPAVHDLKKRLSTHENLKVWYDADDLRPGIPWQKQIEIAITSSASILVLIGKDGLGPWEDEERQAALLFAVEDGRPVIPVLLPEAPDKLALPTFLKIRTWVDFRSGFTEEGITDLVWGITGKK